MLCLGHYAKGKCNFAVCQRKVGASLRWLSSGKRVASGPLGKCRVCLPYHGLPWTGCCVPMRWCGAAAPAKVRRSIKGSSQITEPQPYPPSTEVLGTLVFSKNFLQPHVWHYRLGGSTNFQGFLPGTLARSEELILRSIPPFVPGH